MPNNRNNNFFWYPVHEAGHATVASVLGYPPSSIILDYKFHTAYTNALCPRNTTAQEEVSIIVAGAAAELLVHQQINNCTDDEMLDAIRSRADTRSPRCDFALFNANCTPAPGFTAWDAFIVSAKKAKVIIENNIAMFDNYRTCLELYDEYPAP